MATNNITESTVRLMIAQLQAQLPNTLAAVRAGVDRADNLVSIEVPYTTQYFAYDSALAFVPPSVFVVADDGDFRLGEKGANHINALLRVRVSVVVEDTDVSLLTTKVYRYQDAIFMALNEVQLTNTDGSVKLVVKVTRFAYSPIFTTAQKAGDPQGVFRKEVSLNCEVEHYEPIYKLS